jgi:uncharacterized protein YdeI (YjbR/CyaY-like superfamily)
MAPDPIFFKTPAEMRTWLKKNHASAPELHVGYIKRHAIGKNGNSATSITWQESVAEALCFGWIDGIRRSLDEHRYVIRFTPRRTGSRWSAVNVRLVAELEAAGRMTDAGRAAFAARKDPASPGYKTGGRVGRLDRARLAEFKKNEKAWEFFQAQPPGYRNLLLWWVMDAKKDETRDKRLATLVSTSAAGKRLR